MRACRLVPWEAETIESPGTTIRAQCGFAAGPFPPRTGAKGLEFGFQWVPWERLTQNKSTGFSSRFGNPASQGYPNCHEF